MRVPFRPKLLRAIASVFNLLWFQEENPSILVAQTISSHVCHCVYNGLGPWLLLGVVVHSTHISALNQYHGEKLRVE